MRKRLFYKYPCIYINVICIHSKHFFHMEK
jgi:hypothetical protein